MHRIRTFTIVLWIMAAVPVLPVYANQDDYLKAVQAYADTMLEKARDTYGSEPSPLFASALNRETCAPFSGDALAAIENIPRETWGIRSHDRMLTGGNPMHDQNLYQILYCLTSVTGEQRYADEADKTLKWFFMHCQSPQTGLMAWGEHIGWDFNTETIIDKPAGTTHEFFRPWILWDQSYKLAPAACADFAKGLWEHQIGDQTTGNFSRHAAWDKHGPGKNSEYPRHGGFYIATWAQAYRHTKDPIYLKAIETVLDYFDGRRSPKTGALPAESAKRSEGTIIWPESNLSLAIDLWNSAKFVPEALAQKMLQSAAASDRTYLRLAHDLGPDGKGFVKSANTHTLEPLSYSDPWATGYGEDTEATLSLRCLLRYHQIHDEGYKKLILGAAERYIESEPFIEFPVYPGTLGDVILHMLGAYELSGDRKFLERAEHFAALADQLFLKDSSIPRATSKHDHYEAITRGDTLMMSLLQLWAVKNKTEFNPPLVYCDR